MASLVLVALALSGCTGVPPVDAAPPSSVSTPASATPAPERAQDKKSKALPASQPEWIDIPKINARSSLIALGLNADSTIAVPPVDRPMQASWYRHSPTPGQRGPAVILGHVNGGGEAGIFARLHELRPGDEIRVGRQDGQVARFVVQRVDQVPKSRFPADDVYGNTAGPELRLITCGGAFDDSADSYRDNVIAFAVFTGVVSAGD